MFSAGSEDLTSTKQRDKQKAYFRRNHAASKAKEHAMCWLAYLYLKHQSLWICLLVFYHASFRGKLIEIFMSFCERNFKSTGLWKIKHDLAAWYMIVFLCMCVLVNIYSSWLFGNNNTNIWNITNPKPFSKLFLKLKLRDQVHIPCWVKCYLK